MDAILDDSKGRKQVIFMSIDFSEHTLPVTDIVIGYGGCDAIIISAAEDRTCKVWSFSRGTLLRNIVFPSIIDAIASDPAEHVFYAGSRDGKIFIAGLITERIFSQNHDMYIIGSFSIHIKAVTCLTYSASGNLLISGSEDGTIRVWNARTHNIVCTLKHEKNQGSSAF
ncbi:protein ROOT INITIATION DEFECTIVE 3-like isoform X2 [Prosopis cineraria]|uniref:protein ROOT INITIATION DEFECTIVE 3-like isoform X2 n=1 Tax=Prosopis cineraria TaxID=364024 RepID=UPI00241085D5|nr:protein ROOT INITIATION DEFECTIVE 3-like isoform X2 [Prosopis cineraria]